MRVSIERLLRLVRRRPTAAVPDSDTRSAADRAAARDYWQNEIADDRKRRGTADPRRR